MARYISFTLDDCYDNKNQVVVRIQEDVEFAILQKLAKQIRDRLGKLHENDFTASYTVEYGDDPSMADHGQLRFSDATGDGEFDVLEACVEDAAEKYGFHYEFVSIDLYVDCYR